MKSHAKILSLSPLDNWACMYKNILPTGIFLGLIRGQISAPSQFKNEQKLPEMVFIITNLLVLHFDVNFMKM